MDEALKMVRELAEKLGCTVEEAWPHVMDYVQWRALAGLIGAALGAVVCVILAYVVGRLIQKVKPGLEDDVAKALLYFAVFGLLVGGAVLLTVPLYYHLPVLMNPVGATIMQVLGR